METGTAEIDLIKNERIRKPSGFTLIEVLLVLALVGLMAGIVGGNAGAFIAGGNFEPPDRVLKKSVLDAVYFAGERKRGSILAKHEVFQKLEKVETEDFPEVKLYAVGPLAGADGGKTQYDERGLRLFRIPFHAGCSVPFLAEISFRENEQTLYFDPFSGYALKEIGE
ncbi:MAG: prepilin-type N-terminal cleavage/methylation domain-containing protein [Opitutales bacterium]